MKLFEQINILCFGIASIDLFVVYQDKLNIRCEGTDKTKSNTTIMQVIYRQE